MLYSYVDVYRNNKGSAIFVKGNGSFPKTFIQTNRDQTFGAVFDKDIPRKKREKLGSVVELIDRAGLGINNGLKNVSSRIQRFPI